MSALGRKRTFRNAIGKSALPPKSGRANRPVIDADQSDLWTEKYNEVVAIVVARYSDEPRAELVKQN
jgi:hypothetical protein